MTVTDDIARIARDAKSLLCELQPMADMWTPTAHVVTDEGRHVATLLDPDLLDTPTMAGLQVRLEVAPSGVAVAAVICESYVKRTDTITGALMAHAGGLADEYATDPATDVVRALVIVSCTAQGVHSLRLLPYAWNDQGAPVWLDHTDIADTLMAAGVGAQVVALAEAIAGVEEVAP